MKIFIGWSGNSGREIGKALRMWLLGLLPQVKSLFSPELPKGQPWFAALAEVIREAEAAIVCITPRALESHWPAFEAGAVWNAARGVAGADPQGEPTRILTIAFGIDPADVGEPLSLFQATRFEKADMLRLARDLNRLAGVDARTESDLNEIFESLWPALEANVHHALSLDAQGIATEVGFLRAVRGYWWESINPETHSRLSLMEIARDANSGRISLRGRGYRSDGQRTTTWASQAACANPTEQQIYYYWEGTIETETQANYGGIGKIDFIPSPDGRFESAHGYFLNVKLLIAGPQDRKLTTMVRATDEDVRVMTGADGERVRALVRSMIARLV